MAISIGQDTQIIDLQTGKFTRQGRLVFQQLSKAADAVIAAGVIADANDVGGTYSQSEVQDIADQLNAVIAALSAAE